MQRMNALLLALFALLAFSATASANESERDIHDQIVVVLDASGSMDQRIAGVEKMTAAKDSLIKVMEDIPKDTHVGIVVFGSRRQGWIVDLGPQDRESAKQAISAVSTGPKGTPLGEFIKIGADRLLEAMAKQHGYGTYKLLVVTDGDAQDANLMNRYTPDVVSRGIILDVIGVGMEREHALKRFARAYYDAQNPDEIVVAAKKVVAEVPAVDEEGRNTYEIIGAAFGSDESVLRAIKAFSSSGYHPIGERPRIARNDASRSGSGSPSDPSNYGTPSSPNTAQGDGCQMAPSSGAGSSIPLFLLCGILLVIGMRIDGRRRVPVPVRLTRGPGGRVR